MTNIFAYTPLAPPGTRFIIHEKPTTRQTWALHGTDSWYLGPAFHHYQCYRVWVPCTHTERIVDTVSFFPKAIPIPELTTKMPRSKPPLNLPTHYNNHVFVDPSPNSMTTISCCSANSAKSSTPLLQGWQPSLRGWTPQSKNICHQHLITHDNHLLMPRPLLPLPNPSRNFHIIYAHESHVHTMPPPSLTAKPASLWNTEYSSPTLHTCHMAMLRRKRIWSPRARPPRQPCGTYQHYLLYSFLKGPQTQMTYPCPFCLELLSPKG